MSSASDSPPPAIPGDEVPDALIAEASVWIARLHGPDRKDAERGLRRWLERGSDHARAFGLVADTWEETENLQRVMRWETPPPSSAHIRRRRPLTVARLATAAAVIVVLAIGAAFYWHLSGISTGIGEQRQIALEDGTRVFLNTASRISVSYDEHERRVELKEGEVLFEVAKQPQRPFVVRAGDREIRALGTSFAVRRDASGHRVSVTLVEGSVSVSASRSSGIAGLLAAAPAPAAAGAQAPQSISLSAGQRLTFSPDARVTVDMPELDEVTAWRRGQVVLDDMRLADAVAELNRYSGVQLVVEQPQTAALLVNGLFQTGDSESFAIAMEQTYGLRIVKEPGRIVLSGTPR
jgi:transmembrane sensor